MGPATTGDTATFSRSAVCTLRRVGHTQATLLVVDDEHALRHLFAAGFRRAGYEVLEAATGSECLDTIAEHDVDLVLLDSGLPDIVGPEVVRRLRADRRHATLPIIMVTGRGEVSERVEGLRGGANDYVVKPVVFDELLARVEATLREQVSWQTRLRERIDVHGRLLSELAAAPDGEGGLAVLARAIRDALGFRRLMVVGQVGNGPIVTRAACPPQWSDGAVPELIDDAHGLAGELRRVAGSGASLLYAERARAVFGPDAGPSLLLSVNGAADSAIALLAELGPDAVLGGAAVREAVASLTDLASIVESVAVRSASEVTVVARQEIEDVIEQRRFRPVFQPISRLTDSVVIGFELLTRFADGTPPGVRFAEAHAVGLGRQLELATLEVGLAAATSLPPDVMVSVNVSPSLLGDVALRHLLQRSQRAISLELTENERIADYDEVLSLVSQLPDHVHLSVDDAGSGWASLWHVHSLRPEFVKLDRSWVHGIHGDPARQILLRGLQLFVDEVGGRLIAEGIEDPADVEPLLAVGVTLGQGYLLGRPAPVEHWLGAGAAPHAD